MTRYEQLLKKYLEKKSIHDKKAGNINDFLESLQRYFVDDFKFPEKNVNYILEELDEEFIAIFTLKFELKDSGQDRLLYEKYYSFELLIDYDNNCFKAFDTDYYFPKFDIFFTDLFVNIEQDDSY